MRSVALIAWNNLRRRKGQAWLVGMVISLAVLLFFTGAGLMLELDRPFERMFEELDGPHYSLTFDARIHDPEEIRGWWQSRPEVLSVSGVLPLVSLEESAYVANDDLSKFLIVSERLPVEGLDKVREVAGDVSTPPGPGETWVTTAISQETGIQVGEVIEIPAGEGLVPLKVTAIVVDAVFSAPFNNPTRIWVGAGELAKLFPVRRLNEVAISVRLHDPATSDVLWVEFLNSLGGHFSGGRFDYETVLSGYTAPYDLMAVMLVAFSVFSVLIALFAIHGTITSSILADFTVIGILRVQGFRPRDVRRIYQLQYLALALAAVPVGVAGGIPAVRQGVALLMSTIGAGSASEYLTLLAIVTFVLFIGLVLLFVGLVARRAEHVRPADAIRYGAEPESAHRSGRISIARNDVLPVPLLIALKGLTLQRRRLVFLVLSVFFATLAAALAVNLDHSFTQSRSDLGVLGFDSADVRVTRGGARFGIRHDAFMRAMRVREDVSAIATWDYIDATLLRDDGRPGDNISGTVVAGDMEEIGYRNLRGRHPEGAAEVSIGVTTASREGKDVGDTIRIHLLGRVLPLTVTGVYQTLNNGGNGVRIRLDAVRSANPLYEPIQYGILLVEGVDPDEFSSQLEQEYGEAVDAKPGDYFVGEIMDTVTTGMRVSNGFLTVIFLAAASVFIFNATLMNIAENRRMFGIFKTGGMSPQQMRGCIAWGVALQALAGVAIGLGTWWLAGGAGLSALFAGLGLVAFPVQNHLGATLAIIPVVLLFCIVSSWIASNRLLRLDPRALVIE